MNWIRQARKFRMALGLPPILKGKAEAQPEKAPRQPPTGRPDHYREQTTKPFTGEAKDPLSKLMYDWAGKSLHKWEHYAAHCDAHLAEWRSRAPRLMEIGVQNGGSLELWDTYFGEGTRIAGVDVDPACADLVYPSHIQVFIGDQTHSPTLHHALAHLGGSVDIIIDDGSHKGPDVHATYRELWPHLTVGGWYVIEDLHASYWRDYSSDYGHPESIMAFLAELADDLHGAHHTSGQQHTPWSSLGAIHIYDSIAFIQKAEREMPRAWRMPTERTTAVPASG